MKKTIKTDIREKIATRAYSASAESDWLAAEAIELAYAERRAATAAKAAATRKAKTAMKAPAEMLAAAARRPAGRRTTAH